MKNKNIIVTTDFSDNSKRVFKSAKDLAEKLNSKIYLVNVVNRVDVVPTISPMGAESAQAVQLQKELLDMEIEKAHEKLEDFMRDNFDTTNISAKVLCGDLEIELNEFIDSNNIGYLMIASQGDDDFLDKIFGSNALNLMRELSCPCFVFPPNCKDLEFNHFVYAVSSFYNNDVFENHLLEMVKEFKSNITFIHAEDSHYELYKEKALEISSKLLDVEYSNIDLKLVDTDKPFEGVKDFVENNNCDILCLVSHTDNIFEKLFHKSFVSQALNNIKVPLLCYNENNKF